MEITTKVPSGAQHTTTTVDLPSEDGSSPMVVLVESRAIEGLSLTKVIASCITAPLPVRCTEVRITCDEANFLTLIAEGMETDVPDGEDWVPHTFAYTHDGLSWSQIA